jgi:hypothetical protein
MEVDGEMHHHHPLLEVFLLVVCAAVACLVFLVWEVFVFWFCYFLLLFAPFVATTVLFVCCAGGVLL